MAEVNEYPWQAIVRIQWVETKGTCGGVLINAQWILTAAHCFKYKNYTYKRSWIVLGEHDKSITNESKHLPCPASKVVVHPKYANFDFALVKLPNRINFSKYPHIRPVCPPKSDKDVRRLDCNGYRMETNSQ